MTRTPRLARAAVIILAVLGWVVAWLLGALPLPSFVRPASAHSFYHYECCHDRDCWPLEPGQIRETPQGWVIEGLAEPIPYDWPKLKDSPDGRYHLCTTSGDTGGLPLCLYRPIPSF